ncbi:MAG TPA: glycogen debranching N-terminal domain-containing protein, partial [Candidatus Limnocylindria bacterium]|nr:glycogen debranching N-terminal domain-containing protein [Candidatus Limnocylindria bacterium]
MTLPIQVGPATVTINRDDRVVVCQPDGRIEATADEGFFARDTRFVSGYDMWINGARPVLLNSSPIQFFSARFEFTNGVFIDEIGSIDPHSIAIRLDRTLGGGVHEDYDIVNYARRTVRLTIEIAIESDFADIFDVKRHAIVRRGELNSRWFRSRRELRSAYTNGEFYRELAVAVERADSPPQFANGRLVFVAAIPPKGAWHTCIKWLPITSSRRRPTTLACSAVADEPGSLGVPRLPKVSIETPNETVRHAWAQAVRDMEALRLEDPTFERGVFIPAGGVPWFVTLFGRDALIVSMQGITGYPELAAGALRRLASLQATEDDPERDMEPGKIPHEIRHGELAQLGILPFTPYYGTHDATSLYIIVLSYLYQWLGDESVLRRFLPNAEAAMTWVDRYGDRDGDGFQEYKTRSKHGYYNQGWKDAWDAVPERDGSIAKLPIALCELQGYVYDAKLRLADIYDLLERPEDAERLRGEANRLYQRFNDVFWWESEG